MRNRFKVGITGDPLHRFELADWAYRKQGFESMIVLGVSESTTAIATMETRVIHEFRRFGPGDRLVNDKGSYLCMNRLPGGENAHLGGHALIFLYVVLKV